MANISIKYCGGCNPRYDRVATVDKLFAAFPQLKRTEPEDAGIFLGINGCSCACASLDERYQLAISAVEDYEVISFELENNL